MDISSISGCTSSLFQFKLFAVKTHRVRFAWTRILTKWFCKKCEYWASHIITSYFSQKYLLCKCTCALLQIYTSLFYTTDDVIEWSSKTQPIVKRISAFWLPVIIACRVGLCYCTLILSFIANVIQLKVFLHCMDIGSFKLHWNVKKNSVNVGFSLRVWLIIILDRRNTSMSCRRWTHNRQVSFGVLLYIDFHQALLSLVSAI